MERTDPLGRSSGVMLLHCDPFETSDQLAEELLGLGARGRTVAMDVVRRGDRLVVRFDLPGADPDAVALTLVGNVLSVRAERHDLPAEADELLELERSQGVFARDLLLSDALDTHALEASYRLGVLTVRIPIVGGEPLLAPEIRTGPSRPIAVASSEGLAV